VLSDTPGEEAEPEGAGAEAGEQPA
jgi:hypothetical protein